MAIIAQKKCRPEGRHCSGVGLFGSLAKREALETGDLDGATELLGNGVDVLGNSLVRVLHERLLNKALLLVELLQTAGSHLFLDSLGLPDSAA